MNVFKVSLSDRGQVVIPADIRKKFTTVEFIVTYEEGRIVLSPRNIEEKMKVFVEKLHEMNRKYEKNRKEKIDVMTEILKGGA